MVYNTDNGAGLMPCVPVACGNNNNNYDALLLFLWLGMMGGGAWGRFGFGGGFPGGFGGFGPGAVGFGVQELQLNNIGDRVSRTQSTAEGIYDQTRDNAQRIEATKDIASNGFFAIQRDLCSAFANSAALANSNHHDLTRQNSDIRFQLADCCCDGKARSAETNRLLESGFCRLGNMYESGKAEILRAIDCVGDRLERKMDAQRMAELEAKNLKLEGMLSQQNQTGQLANMIQAALAAQQPRGCGCPSTPCGCQNPICTVLDSWVTRWANAQNIPAAQPAA